MLIDKPCCDFQKCKHHFDGNCMNKIEYGRCPYNRQKAEIERLQNENGVTYRLLKFAHDRIKELDRLYEEFKAEAIKEFAERLKAKGDRYAWVVGISKDEINHLVKEMTEGNENG